LSCEVFYNLEDSSPSYSCKQDMLMNVSCILPKMRLNNFEMELNDDKLTWKLNRFKRIQKMWLISIYYMEFQLLYAITNKCIHVNIWRLMLSNRQQIIDYISFALQSIRIYLRATIVITLAWPCWITRTIIIPMTAIAIRVTVSIRCIIGHEWAILGHFQSKRSQVSPDAIGSSKETCTRLIKYFPFKNL